MAAKTIDANFFKKYAGTNREYDKVYRDHSYIEECIELFEAEDAPKVRSLCILGTGTGIALKDFKKAFGVNPYGCEISEWAYARTPKAARARVKNQDMVDYLRQVAARKQVFDLVFSNSFIYLPRRELSGVLKILAKSARYVHFRSSFKDEYCRDPYRRILESYDWWNSRLKHAGFEELRTPFGSPTYLWRSRSLF